MSNISSLARGPARSKGINRMVDKKEFKVGGTLETLMIKGSNS